MKNQSYRNVNENPCNMCMPMGGILPFKGIERSMVIIHGSQGCSTYMRRHIAEHFNEPIDVASSSLNEKGTIYGGEKNLKQGLDNLIKLYNPGMIGILTTCLAETIGEDIDRIAAEYKAERGLDRLPLITVPTPGYGGAHSEGYWLAVKRIIASVAEKTRLHSRVNVIVPNISPADIREIKRILQLMKVDYTLCPDFSDTLDRPFVKPYVKIPEGGTRIEDIAAMPGAPVTIQMGVTVDEGMSPGKYLEEEFGVPLVNVPIPMGVRATDAFLDTLRHLTGRERPDILEAERGRLLDCMIDSHKYNFQGRSVIFGDPEIVYAVASTCMENGIYPVVAATGSKGAKFSEAIKKILAGCPDETDILNEADFTGIREKSRQRGANIAIGHSDGKFLTEREGIPLVRIGFPIHDRVGGQRLLSVGYTGTGMFLDRVTNTLLERKHSNYRAAMYEKYYTGTA
ncbi:nitrogenase FeMo-cofactor scaffold and assembly protein NifN [Desulfocucumis palustris]|uniref:Nitrogenase FeMo-cofactor scaffold and assembly protein NifN n=1 Tax=Desulfocucumis palustris TaxID=1898651 RepID=A0A2L2XFR7_9FIRM|nr:nitrogenase component 1 [Desulfocucumis palustris]GBF33076.1 nitrogenase FeMo-cofactor scaffold and assembly protein NifN [Desulfocucumis palustris]